MASALQFDGVNDYCSILSQLLHTEIGRTTFEYEIYAAPDIDQSTFRVFGNSGTFAGQFSILTTGVQIRLGGAGASQVNIPYVQVFDGLYHTYLIRRDGNNYSLLIDGILVASTTSAAATGGNGVTLLGRVSGNYTHTNVGYITFRNSIGGTALFNWDATASSHAAGTPILTDTVGGNNATGVNMPTDGSAWLDLGGIGTTTLVVPSIVSEEAFGEPTVTLLTQLVTVASIASEEAFGTPNMVVGETLVLPVSIVSAESFGTPNVTSIGLVTQFLTVATIPSGEEFGTPDVSLFDKDLLVVSIQSEESFGKPKVTGGLIVVNTLGIPEVTLAQISDANHAINKVGNDVGNARGSIYQSAVVRIIDHEDNDITATDDPTKMALFESIRHGQPWNKYRGHREHIIHYGSIITEGTSMNQIFPTHDYEEFE